MVITPLDKQGTRIETKALIRQGKIRRLSCEICGAAGAEVHHPDYSDPNRVIWLCKHHPMMKYTVVKDIIKDLEDICRLCSARSFAALWSHSTTNHWLSCARRFIQVVWNCITT
jgi:hypothetical protein